MKILWFTNIPSPYRVSFFNELSKSNEVHVVFENNYSRERNDEWKKYGPVSFSFVRLKGFRYGVASLVPLFLKKQLKKVFSQKYDCVFVSNYSSICGLGVIHYCLKHRIKYYLESDGAFPKVKEFWLKKKIKNYCISNAKKCFSTSKENDAYFLHYGSTIDRIARYHFSSFYKKEIVNQSATITRNAIRRKFDLWIDKKIIISVGQFIDRKNFDLFLDIAKQRNKHQFVLVGEGPLKEHYLDRIKKESILNVVIIPFLPKKQLFELMSACDVFLFTTKEDIWGLVIGEALACGLPVVSTSKSQAALEMITDGINGFLCDCACPEQFAQRIDCCFDTDKKNNAITVAKEYSLEVMVKQHNDILKSELKRKKMIFLGYYSCNESLNKANPSFAGINMQKNIIQSLLEDDSLDIHFISLRPCAPFPHSPFRIKRREYYNKKMKCHFIEVPFLNVQILKQFSQIRNIKKTIRLLAKKENFSYILGFNAFPVIGASLMYSYKKYKLKPFAFIADCPIPSKPYSFIMSIFRRIMDKATLSLIKRIKYLILINENIKKRYSLVQPCLTINGFYEEKQVSSTEKVEIEFRNNSFLFAGSLSEYNCINKLCEAFSKMPDFNLYIAGTGELTNIVTHYSKTFNNIHYLGLCDNNTVLEYEKKADYLLLFRDENNIITELTFPSKFFEYVSIGKPIITNFSINKLIDEKTILCKNSNPDCILNTLISLKGQEYEKMARNGFLLKKIIKNEYSISRNGQLINDFIDRCLNNENDRFCN